MSRSKLKAFQLALAHSESAQDKLWQRKAKQARLDKSNALKRSRELV